MINYIIVHNMFKSIVNYQWLCSLRTKYSKRWFYLLLKNLKNGKIEEGIWCHLKILKNKKSLYLNVLWVRGCFCLRFRCHFKLWRIIKMVWVIFSCMLNELAFLYNIFKLVPQRFCDIWLTLRLSNTGDNSSRSYYCALI